MSIRVLVVDDSNLARRVIQGELSKDPDIEVVGTAKDPLDASEKIEALLPDVMTLDLELPKMDGLTFLRSLMRHHPMPVVIVSAYTQRGSRLAMEALESGAVDIVPKPGGALNVTEMSAELVAKVRAASEARVGRNFAPAEGRAHPAQARWAVPGAGVGAMRNAGPRPADREPVQVLPPLGRSLPPDRVIAIGSSTGGTQALQHILTRLPADMPPILIVQHMPEGFTNAFAGRLNQLCQLEVKEAEHNDSVLPGRVLVAPGARHMVLRRTGSRLWVEITDGPRVCRQKPSVEVLFQSVAKVAGKSAIGAILTGMGGDGADGMLTMKQAGATTIAEDEKSCVVFGMPKEAIKRGGVDHIVHLHDIAAMLTRLS
ncbi:MAG TPA: chemotaxis response regulator protein-glutamate methylesterase [bacterium]|nr:chemotaxis response regulator protein-glutamate methylesterase [bacterium]